jgi:hypothetical protein
MKQEGTKAIRITLIVLVFFVGPATAKAANLLLNPGFESGDLSSWTVGGNNGGFGVNINGVVLPVTGTPDAPGLFYSSQQNVRSGNFAAYAITAGDSQPGFNEYASFSQHLSLQSGTYELGFWLSTIDSNGGVGLYSAMSSGRLGIYVDGIQIPFTIAPLSSSTLTSDWVEFASQDFLTSGVHSIQFDISAGGTARVGVSLDDTFVEAVPEPSSVALLTFGLMPLGFTVKAYATARSKN